MRRTPKVMAMAVIAALLLPTTPIRAAVEDRVATKTFRRTVYTFLTSSGPVTVEAPFFVEFVGLLHVPWLKVDRIGISLAPRTALGEPIPFSGSLIIHPERSDLDPTQIVPPPDFPVLGIGFEFAMSTQTYSNPARASASASTVTDFFGLDNNEIQVCGRLRGFVESDVFLMGHYIYFNLIPFGSSDDDAHDGRTVFGCAPVSARAEVNSGGPATAEAKFFSSHTSSVSNVEYQDENGVWHPYPGGGSMRADGGCAGYAAPGAGDIHGDCTVDGAHH